MADPSRQQAERPLTPDPPQPPGTPDPPDLDVDLEQFELAEDIPVHSDVNPEAGAPEPP